MKTDTEYWEEEVQNWAAYWEHVQSILREFDADYTPGEIQPGRIFDDSFRSLIKL